MSNMTFADFDLNPAISKALAACGYTKPTPVQAEAIPAALNGDDLVVSAQTGTGKTAAFVIPALEQLLKQGDKHSAHKKPRVLILTPTRELASQVTKAAAEYGRYAKFNIISLVGGMPYFGQIKDLARGTDVIVATPGRLMDHIEQKRVDLSAIQMLVLDEADRMLDMGFIEDVQYIAKLTPSSRQTLLFSATLDNQLMKAVKHLLKSPVRIDLSTDVISSPQVEQEMYRVPGVQQKMQLLKHFLQDEQVYKAIIFTATKISADRLADRLTEQGFTAAALHGDLRQNVRNRTLEQLRRGKIQFLVATDVAARGIDISDISHVFNFDLPRNYEDYVHRIGRTGRAGKTGRAISFVLPTETRQVQGIEKYIGQRIKMIRDGDLPINKDYSHELKRKSIESDDREFSKEKRSFKSDKFSGSKEKRSFESDKFSDKKEKRPFKSDRFSESKEKRSFKSDKFSDKKEKRTRISDRFAKEDLDPRISFKEARPKRASKLFADDSTESRGSRFKKDGDFKRDGGFKKESRFKKDDGFKKESRFKRDGDSSRDGGFKKESRFKKDGDSRRDGGFKKESRFKKDGDSSRAGGFKKESRFKKDSGSSRDGERRSIRSERSGKPARSGGAKRSYR